MRDIPEGYSIWCFADRMELIAPDGELVGNYHVTISGELIIEEAMTHKAIYTVCQWDPGCPVCSERRSKHSGMKSA